MSDTPISDSTPHNVAELGMLCRRLERELNASNAIIRQQQLLDEENLRLQERIKRLKKAGNGMYEFINPPSPSMRTSRMDNLLQGWDDAKIGKEAKL